MCCVSVCVCVSFTPYVEAAAHTIASPGIAAAGPIAFKFGCQCVSATFGLPAANVCGGGLSRG